MVATEADAYMVTYQLLGTEVGCLKRRYFVQIRQGGMKDGVQKQLWSSTERAQRIRKFWKLSE